MTPEELEAITQHRFDWWNCGAPAVEDGITESKEAARIRDVLVEEVRRLRGLVKDICDFACFCGELAQVDQPCYVCEKWGGAE